MKIAKPLLILLGFLAVGLGIVGTVVPILPTTPFLLLAFYCFAKSSTRIRDWFVATKLYKKYLQDYVESNSMTLSKKLTILSIASLFLILAIILTPFLWVRILLAILMVAKYYYFLFRIKTKKNPKIVEELRNSQ